MAERPPRRQADRDRRHQVAAVTGINRQFQKSSRREPAVLFCSDSKHGISLANIRSVRRLHMRIQETNRILKESAIARHSTHQQHQDEGMMSKAWRMVSHLPQT